MKKILLLLAAVGAVWTARAEGYQVNNLSARQTGMGHVGAAMKLDSESIYFNPAGTAFQQSRFDLSVGMAGIFSNCHFRKLPALTNDYTPGKTEVSKNFATPLFFYANYKATDRLAVGLGFYTPDGSGVEWDDNWSGAHLVQKISLAAFTVQPTLSYRLTDRLSVGAGINITWGNFDLSRSMLSPAKRQAMVTGMLDPKIGQLQALIPILPAEQQAAYQAQLQQLQGAKQFIEGTMDRTLVSAALEGNSDVAVGINAGILWDINDQWSLGMTWRSRMNMKVARGTATMNIDPAAAALLAQLGEASGSSLLPPLDKGTFRAELPLPTTVVWGVSFRPTPKWDFAVDLQWVGWSAYKALNVVFNEAELGIKPIYSVKNYANTLIFRFGGQYRATNFLTARMGMYVDESPVSSYYLNPETPSMTKVSYTAGLTLRPAKCLTVDLAYSFVSAADPERTGSYPIYGYETGTLEEVFTGNYSLHANVFSIGVGLHF